MNKKYQVFGKRDLNFIKKNQGSLFHFDYSLICPP
jgi:hypothetical protein